MRLQVRQQDRRDEARTWQAATTHIREGAYSLEVPTAGLEAPRPAWWIAGYLRVEWVGAAGSLQVQARAAAPDTYRDLIPTTAVNEGDIVVSVPNRIVASDTLINIPAGPCRITYHPINRQ